MTRLKAIRMLIAFQGYKYFKLYQMDVTYMYYDITEEGYVEQPPGF